MSLILVGIGNVNARKRRLLELSQLVMIEEVAKTEANMTDINFCMPSVVSITVTLRRNFTVHCSK